jgi:DNA-binding transcriptional MerR regulator
VTRVANRRRYGTDHLRRVAFIRICQDAGLALDDIAVLVDPAQPRQVRQGVVRVRLREVDQEIERLAPRARR